MLHVHQATLRASSDFPAFIPCARCQQAAYKDHQSTLSLFYSTLKHFIKNALFDLKTGNQETNTMTHVSCGSADMSRMVLLGWERMRTQAPHRHGEFMVPRFVHLSGLFLSLLYSASLERWLGSRCGSASDCTGPHHRSNRPVKP